VNLFFNEIHFQREGRNGVLMTHLYQYSTSTKWLVIPVSLPDIIVAGDLPGSGKGWAGASGNQVYGCELEKVGGLQ
jgi:hypothetical protein